MFYVDTLWKTFRITSQLKDKVMCENWESGVGFLKEDKGN